MAFDNLLGQDIDKRFIIYTCTGIGLSSLVLTAVEVSILVELENHLGIASIGELAYPISRGLFGDCLQASITGPMVRFRHVEKMVDDIAKSLTNLRRLNGSYAGSDESAYGTVYVPVEEKRLDRNG
ncbi:hypothetical protein GQ53DRAFT_820951 [Thozetella sp. PMI_491]|nr:hypothetical protein GQ53DRAFT_820951 [Thozetella sp. PMI_491]